MASKAPVRHICAFSQCHRLRAVSRPVDTQFNTASEVLHNLNKLSPSRARCFSSTIPKNQDAEQMGPRWAQTPRGMSMPFRLRPRPKNNEWKCNDDPTKVDAMYKKFLGEGGDKLLSDEVRWLAITHKSFDQGKRGFNDRLAYMGKRIVELQTSVALISAPRAPTEEIGTDSFGRLPYAHSALSGLSNLAGLSKEKALDKRRLYQLGDSYGITRVLRWRPKKAENLLGSGLEIVVAQSVYAIVGAVALEKGGDVANRIVREKILIPLGLTT